MEPVEFLYHYTTVDVLALILKNQTIRLRALNLMDDLQEEMNKDSTGMGRCCFVSSWTDKDTEIIPMWKMYSENGQGVRIKLRKNPFVTYSYDEREFSRYVYNPDHLNMDTSIPLEDVSNSTFTVTTYFKNKQLHQITYTDDSNLLNPNLWSEDETQVQMNYGSLGKYKNKYWSFQSEWRYILNILPISLERLNFLVQNNGPSFVSLMRDISNGRLSLPFSYYDLKIEAQAFSEMQILLGPNMSEGKKVIIDTLVNKYNPSALIENSTLSGLIR